MVTADSCIDCGESSPTQRCTPCQRRHNDHLRAEHDLMIRAAFRAADGHALGRTSRTRRPTRNASTDARRDDAAQQS